MSNKRNFRRKGNKRPEHGPTWEGFGAGSNNTHVARARKKWKRIAARTERHTGKPSSSFHPMTSGSRRPKPRPDE